VIKENLPGILGTEAPRPYWVWAFLNSSCLRCALYATPNSPEAIDDEFLAITLSFCPILWGSLGRSFGCGDTGCPERGGEGHLVGRGFGHFGVLFAWA
jgi:hypothetical protein